MNGAKPSLGTSGDPSKNNIQVIFDDPTGNWASTWAAAMAGKSDPDYSVTNNSDNKKTKVRLGKSWVKLNSVPLTGGSNPVANVLITGVVQTTSVDFGPAITFDGHSPPNGNGGNCTYLYESIP